ncbi:hypothetical protein [Streptomyces sp. NPDC054849]
MNHQSSPTAPPAGLAAAATALVSLTEMYAGLPTPYVTIHTFEGTPTIHFQLTTPHGFEQWRTALVVPAEAIDLTAYAGSTWLAANAVFQGIEIKLAGYGIELAPGLSAVAA